MAPAKAGTLAHADVGEGVARRPWREAGSQGRWGVHAYPSCPHSLAEAPVRRKLEGHQACHRQAMLQGAASMLAQLMKVVAALRLVMAHHQVNRQNGQHLLALPAALPRSAVGQVNRKAHVRNRSVVRHRTKVAHHRMEAVRHRTKVARHQTEAALH